MTGAMEHCKTVLLKRKGGWDDVVDDCRATVGKPSLGKEPSDAFKESILIAEHSPIRDISIRWRWENMPHWVVVHWVRHKFEKYVRTQRSDRTGIPREKLPQDEPSTITCEANCQSIIDAWRKRLCYQASPETRQSAEDVKVKLGDPESPVYEPQLSNVLVPNCIYRFGCPEPNPCKFFEKFVEDCEARSINLSKATISERYAFYNEYFKRTRGFAEEDTNPGSKQISIFDDKDGGE